MDNQPWDKAKLEEWKKFWESEMGQEALKKMQAIKEDMLARAMAQGDSDSVMAYIGRAAGIEMILQDIEFGINAADKTAEKEEPQKSKK